MPETKSKPKPKSIPKWNLTQDDYIELLRSIELNAQTITTLVNDIKRIKIRMGL